MCGGGSSKAADSVGKWADSHSDSRNFNGFQSDFGIAKIYVLLLVKIMKVRKNNKA